MLNAHDGLPWIAVIAAACGVTGLAIGLTNLWTRSDARQTDGDADAADRFGSNGAVLDRMSPQMRDDYQDAAQRERWLPARVAAVVLGAAVLVPAMAVWLPSPSAVLSWYEMPDWLWWAWMASLLLSGVLSLAHALWRRVRHGASFRWFGMPTPFDRAVRTLPLGVLVAAAAEAAFQYRAAADAGLPLP